MLDLNLGMWESLDPLPYQFKRGISSTWISSIVFYDRFYLLERYGGDFCYFDLQRKHLECVGKLRPPPSSSSMDEEGELVLVSGSTNKALVVGGLRRDNAGMSFRLWNFSNIVDDEATNVVCIEMDQTPSHMFNLVTWRDEEEEEEECREVRVK